MKKVSNWNAMSSMEARFNSTPCRDPLLPLIAVLSSVRSRPGRSGARAATAANVSGERTLLAVRSGEFEEAEVFQFRSVREFLTRTHLHHLHQLPYRSFGLDWRIT